MSASIPRSSHQDQSSFTTTMERHYSSGPLERIKRMVTRFPIRDVSYLTSMCFLIGAGFFAANGFFYVLPYTQPQTNFATELTVAAPVTSCIGDFFFFFGCSFAVLESLNTGRKVHGPETIRAVTEPATTHKTSHKHGGDLEARTMESSTVEKEKHHHVSSEDGTSTPSPITSGMSSSSSHTIVLIGDPNFTWFPSVKNLRNYYVRDIAFIAAVISWTGILFFTVSTVAYIPGATDLTVTNNYYYIALLPTFMGGFLFLVAAVMQTALTQRKWYLPALNRLGWYAGIWNSVGSLGFALGGCLWYAGEKYFFSASLASFWGAWGWFLGSLLSWYIVMDHYP